MLLYYQSHLGDDISIKEGTTQYSKEEKKVMKKRNFVCGIALCLALSVAGCGKSSEEQQAVNYYQNELGLDKEDAEELAHAIYGEDEEEPGVTEETHEEAPEETVVEPLPELVNSEWYDQKVQIYDMIFNFDYCMTEEEIRKIVEGSAYDVELLEDFDENGEIRLSSLAVNGNLEASFYKRSSSLIKLSEYGWFGDEDCYCCAYGGWGATCWYDKASVEFKDFQTRDDVLAYLAENGFVEVEREQATYAENLRKGSMIFPEDTPVEYADVPHYYCNGVQSITFFKVHKLDETDQEFEYGYYTRHYSGAHLNVVNYATFEFNTDGTIVSREYSHAWDYNDDAFGSRSPGLYVPGFYSQSDFTEYFMIMGERID